MPLTREQDAAAGPRRRGGGFGGPDDDGGRLEGAKRMVYELLGNLLATTGAPTFQEDHDNNVDNVDGGGGATLAPSNAFESPYGFVGFNLDRVPPDGRTLREALPEWELRAIGTTD